VENTNQCCPSGNQVQAAYPVLNKARRQHLLPSRWQVGLFTPMDYRRLLEQISGKSREH